jgi:hypothetical protein
MSTILTPTTSLTTIKVNYNSPRMILISYPGDTTLTATATEGKVDVNVSGYITYIPVDNKDGYEDIITINCVSKIANEYGEYETSDDLVVNVVVLPQPDTIITKLETVNVELGNTSNEVVYAVTADTTFEFIVEDENICKVVDNKIKGLGIGKTKVGYSAISPTTREVTGEIEVTVYQGTLDSPTTSDGVILNVTAGRHNRFTIDYNTDTTNLKVTTQNTKSVVFDGGEVTSLEGLYSSFNKVGDNYFKLTGYSVNKDTVEKYTIQSILKDGSAVSPEVELTVNVLTNPDAYADDDGDYTTEDLLTLLNSSIPFQKKLAMIRTGGSSEVNFILDELENYRLNILIVEDSDVGCELQLGLYDLIVKILRYVTLDETKFKVYFAILNLFFKNYSESFNDTNMHLYLDNWTGRNKKSLQTYKNLAVLISSLCDITTRQANLNTIDMDNIFDMDTTNFTEVMRDSLVKYYVV